MEKEQVTYIKKRDQLVKVAEDITNDQCGKYPPHKCNKKVKDKWNNKWSFIYHQTMTKLARENGLEK